MTSLGTSSLFHTDIINCNLDISLSRLVNSPEIQSWILRAPNPVGMGKDQLSIPSGSLYDLFRLMPGLTSYKPQSAWIYDELHGWSYYTFIITGRRMFHSHVS